MSQVQVFTNGKWVGAGSQTVDASNCIDMIINPIMFYRSGGPTWAFSTGYRQQYAGAVEAVRVMAPEDLSALLVGGTGGSLTPVYPMVSRCSSFPDGTKVICYGYQMAQSSGSTMQDSQSVFMIGIPLEDVNVDTKLEMIWYPSNYGQISDYVSGSIEGALRHKFNMVRVSPATGPSNPKLTNIAFFAVTWGMIRAALQLKPAAIASNFLGYEGNWQSHTVQFRKTVSA